MNTHTHTHCIHTQYKEMARQNTDQMVWRQFAYFSTLQANIATFDYLVCYHALPGIVDAMSVGVA